MRELPVGRHVTVIGAGNTAIDAATIAKRLGAERVTIVYRRGEDEMTAYDFEYTFIKKRRRRVSLFQASRCGLSGRNGRVTGLECLRVEAGPPGPDGRSVAATGFWAASFVIPCDQVIKAIGQEKLIDLYAQFGLELGRGYVKGRCRPTHFTAESLCGWRLHSRHPATP